MKGRPVAYSAEELAFVQALRGMPRDVLAHLFSDVFQRTDVRMEHLVGLCKRRGWTSRSAWTPAEDDRLRAEYPHTVTASLALKLNRSASSTYQRAYALGLEKSEAFRASPEASRFRRGEPVGKAYWFKPGHPPANKGIARRKGWAPGRMSANQFTPGQAGWNWKPVGSVRVIDGYEYTKVSDLRKVPWTRNWRPTHVLNYEALHGPVPPGHALKSVDGDRLNTDAGNWQLVSRSIMPRLNGGRAGRLGYDEAPPELKPTIMAVAKLATAAHARARAAGGKEP